MHNFVTVQTLVHEMDDALDDDNNSGFRILFKISRDTSRASYDP